MKSFLYLIILGLTACCNSTSTVKEVEIPTVMPKSMDSICIKYPTHISYPVRGLDSVDWDKPVSLVVKAIPTTTQSQTIEHIRYYGYFIRIHGNPYQKEDVWLRADEVEYFEQVDCKLYGKVFLRKYKETK